MLWRSGRRQLINPRSLNHRLSIPQLSLPQFAAAAALLVVGAASCSNPDEQRVKSTTQASYDLQTGKLAEITYDQNKNGRIDTWTKMNGSLPVSSRLDTNEDGKIDRWETYGPDGKLTKVDFERPPTPDAAHPTPIYTGQPNATAFIAADGSIERVEYFDLSPTGQREVTLREFYNAQKQLTRTEEDSDGDGLMDLFQTFVDGVLRTTEFDEKKPLDGKPDRRMTYSADGVLVLIETEPDGRGGYLTKKSPGK